MHSRRALTEKEFVMDFMASEEHLSDLYNHAVIDSSCPVLRKIFSQCLLDAQSIQYSLFDVCEKRGWNKVNLVSDRQIEAIVKKYSSYNQL